MNERFRGDRQVIDLMLAHAPDNKIEGAYNRALHLERRRELAQIWAELRSGAMYELTASSQPLVAPDQVTIKVRAAPDGWPIRSSDDMDVNDVGATWTGTLARDDSWYVRFAPEP
jgi:hypothetical protein